jgi:single-strand DNA-binding protein
MVNRATLIGNLGKDPEVKRLENGATVAKFSIATTDSYKKDNGEWENQTEWHDIVVWKGGAEYAEKYLKKGDKVYIEGKITHRKYTDKDGIERYPTEIVANICKSLEKKENNSTNSDTQTSTPSVQTPKDDSPFSQPMPTNIAPLPQKGDVFKNNDNESIKINVMSVESGMVNYSVGEKPFSHTYDEWRTKIAPKITLIDGMPF